MVCSAFIQNSHFHFILIENENRNVVIDFRVLFFYYTSIFILGHLLNGVSLELGGRRQGIEEDRSFYQEDIETSGSQRVCTGPRAEGLGVARAQGVRMGGHSALGSHCCLQ